jgi:hypothetical protein
MTIASDIGRPVTARRFWFGAAAYLLPTFPIAFVWHLVLFRAGRSHLAGLPRRSNHSVRVGLDDNPGSDLFMGFPRVFPGPRRSFVIDVLLYGMAIGMLSWSFTTLAVAAKHPMTSTSDFFLLETAFAAVQFVIVGPLIALAHRT